MKLIVLAVVLAATAVGVVAQEREDRTLLLNQEMRAIINEASGERAMHHVLEIRDFISGEFEPVPLVDVFDYLKASEKTGQIKLVEKPDAGPAAKGAKPPIKKGP